MNDRLSINQYKIKRKWGRRFRSIASLFQDRERYAHRRDFSLRVSGLNPYVAHARPANWALRIKLTIIAVSLITTAILALSHPYFQVNHVEIRGIERLSEGDMRTQIDEILQRRRFFVFRNSNYFLLNVSDVHDALKEKYPLRSVIVQKSFPENLSVVIEEKISTIIYDNGKEYSYLDGGGMVVEVRLPVEESEWKNADGTVPVIVTSTATAASSTEPAFTNQIHTLNTGRVIGEMGDFPIVYDTRSKSVAVNERAVNPETAQGIFTWFNLMIKSDIRPRYFRIDNELGNVAIITAEGWEIRGRVDKDIEKQWDELLLILKNKISRRASLHYIDIRYDGRVYWQ